MTVRRFGQRGPLSDEDMRLWEMMKQRLEPLRNAKRRVISSDHEADGPASAGMAAKPPKPATPAKPGPRQRQFDTVVPKVAAPVPKKTSFVPAVAPRSAPIEKRKSRQLAKGQRPIEAVLDLHGMRQREAHAALRHFIAKSSAGGLKFVKVITGKGVRSADEGTRNRAFDARVAGDWGEGERGVLKRLVPDWLREAGIGALVVGFSSAGRGHGGEGALYVELRRKDRMPRKS